MDINTKIEVTPPVIRGKPRTVYAVDGLSAYEIAVKHGFEGTEEEWLNTIVRGEPGYTPELGVDYFNGLSAYELAVKKGFEGTEEDWLASLRGADGDTPVKGVHYSDGLSAYDIAKKGGYKGTEAEWLASLKGADGKSGGAFYNDVIPFNQDNPTLGVAYTVRAEHYPFVEFSRYKKGDIYSRQWNNADGTTRKGTALLRFEGTSNSLYSFTLLALIYDGNGVNGLSAYELAVKHGFVGTEEDWVNENIYPKFYQDGVLVKKITFSVSGDTLSIDTET